MKKILILLAFFSPLVLNAYYGDIQNFIIEGNSICLNAPEEASKSYISQESSVSKNATWKAGITLSFAPTSSNYLKWFIMADSTNVNASSNGYYLMFGTAKRSISFHRLKNGKSTLIYEEEEKLLDNPRNNIKIEVRRSQSDYWTVDYVLNDSVSNFVDFYDEQVSCSSYSGWHCVYTKTRSKSFCFANVKVDGEESSVARIPKVGELLINEVLFNPIGDGVDFIEIYNASDVSIDLSVCMLGNKKQIYSIPYYVLESDSCVAITKDSLTLCSQYNCISPINIIQVDKMLPLPNDSGYIRLLADTVQIDSLFYTTDMHHALLENAEGISLERSKDGGWYSASTILKATPGYKNSRYITENNGESSSDENSDEYFKLLSSSVRIYNYDMPEKVELLYRLNTQCRLSVRVYTLAGYPVFTILDSELVSGEGKLYWDGRGEDLGVLPVGLYVILIEIYDTDGEYRLVKLPVAIVP